MKKKIRLWHILILFGTALTAAFIYALHEFSLPKYKIEENPIKISASFNEDCLIAAYDYYFCTYDDEGYDKIYTDFHIKDFAAYSRKHMIFIDDNGNLYQYDGGEFTKTQYNNVKDVIYIHNSYMILTESGDIFIGDLLVCNMDIAELIGVNGWTSSFDEVYGLDEDGSLVVYNAESESIWKYSDEFIDEYLSNSVYSLFVTENNEILIKYGRADLSEFLCSENIEVQCVSPRVKSFEGIALCGNQIVILQPNSDDKTIEVIDVPFNLRLSRLVNGISKIDCIYTSAESGWFNRHQLIYIKSGDYIFVCSLE